MEVFLSFEPKRVCFCLCAQLFLTLCNPCTIACQAPLSIGFSRQKYQSGLPFSPPGDLPDPGIKLTSLALQVHSLPLSSGESPLRGCVCGMLLILSLSSSWTIQGSLIPISQLIFTLYFSIICTVLCLVAQSCPTLCDPMHCSPPGSSVHGDSPGRNTGVGYHALLQGVFPTQGSNPSLSRCWRIIYHLSHQGSPRLLEWVAYPFSRGSS